jgi:hypothetical protein
LTCQTKRQGDSPQPHFNPTGQQQEIQLLRSILLTLGGMSSKMLKSEHVCSILVANEKITGFDAKKQWLGNGNDFNGATLLSNAN